MGNAIRFSDRPGDSPVKHLLFILLSLPVWGSTSDAAPKFDALVARSRSLYAQERWDEFFGSTTVLRHFFPKSDIQALSLLEALALIRHCQWEMADRILKEPKLSAYELTRSIQTLLQLERTRHDRPLIMGPVSDRDLRYQWKLVRIPSDLNAALKLRRPVRNLCSGRSKP